MPLVRRKKLVLVTVTLALTFWMTISMTIELTESGNLKKQSLRKVREETQLEEKLKAGEAAALKDAQKRKEMEGFKMVMGKRMNILDESCKTLKEINTFRDVYKTDHLSHLMVDDKNKFIYCFIPKIANTNFRRIFLSMQEIVSADRAPNLSGYEIYSKYLDKFVYLHTFNKTARDYRLNNYKKITFVRKPLERLLSAYRNKFFHPNDKLRMEYYEKVLEFYAKYPVVAENIRSMAEFEKKPITFHEFLIYWADTFEVGGHINEHFMTYNDLCQPCEVKYDYVGKYDTLNSDVHYIFKDLGVEVNFPERNDNYSSTETKDLVLNYYIDMPADVMKRVWDVLRTDYILFDYNIPPWLRNKLNS